MFYRKHDRVTIDCSEDGQTRQEFADECDINVLMRRYETTGIMPGDASLMQYGDFTQLPDFMTAMNTVARANEAFAALPAAVRRRFGNDPAEYVEFVSNPENIDEVRKLGLAAEVPAKPQDAPPEAKPAPSGPVTPPAAPAA